MGRRIALAFALVLVLVAVFAVLRQRERRLAAAAREQAQLLRFDERAVAGIVLEVAGVGWQLARQPAGWRIVSPLADAADERAVAALLRACRQTPVLRVIEEPEALHAYGLDPPRARIRLEGVEAPALDIGDGDPTGTGVFARVAGRPGVLVLDAGVGQALLRADPGWLRDRALVRLAAAEVARVEIRDGARQVRLARESGGWWIVAPTRLPASDIEMDRLLRGLQGARIRAFADEFRPEDPALGLGAGAVEIRIATSEGDQVVRLGAATSDGARYATRKDRDTVLLLESTSVPAVPADLDALLDRRLTKVNRYAVAAFEYRRGARRLEARRTGERTWVRGDDGGPLDAESVYGLLAGILEAPTVGWTPGEDAPAVLPEAVLDFRLQDGARDRIEVYRDGTARLASLSRLRFRLGAPVPEVPAGEAEAAAR